MKTKSEIARSMLPYRDELVNSVVTLCRIPSVKTEALPDAPFGQANAKALATFLELGQSLGFKAVNLGGYCGYLEWGDQGPLIAVLGHLDVVPAIDGWTKDPFSPVVTSDRIIARGTADDKGPVAAALFALKALKDEGFVPAGRIRLIAGLDEESGSECMAYYVQHAELPIAGFTPDANFPVIYAEKGIVHLKLCGHFETQTDELMISGKRLIAASAGQRANMVPALCELIWQDENGLVTTEKFTGKAAHASTPWDGDNAILKALLAAAQEQTPHPFVTAAVNLLGAKDPGESWKGVNLGIASRDSSGPLTVNPGILRLDKTSAELTLDIRYPATGSFDQLLKRLEETTHVKSLEVKVLQHLAPLQYDPETPLVKTLMAVYNQVTESLASAIAIGGGTYARTMPNVVAFGPSFPDDPDVCHQVDEYITFDKLLASAAVYKEAIRALAQ